VAVTGVWSRRLQRYAHLGLATALGVYLYSPLGEVAAAELAVQLVVFPALALSGLLLWRGGRLRSWLRRRRGAREAAGDESDGPSGGDGSRESESTSGARAP
jgi:type VI protein secretion system component VasK